MTVWYILYVKKAFVYGSDTGIGECKLTLSHQVFVEVHEAFHQNLHRTQNFFFLASVQGNEAFFQNLQISLSSLISQNQLWRERQVESGQRLLRQGKRAGSECEEFF